MCDVMITISAPYRRALGPYRLDLLPVYCRYTGLPATLPAGLSDPTGVNSSNPGLHAQYAAVHGVPCCVAA